MRRTSLSLKLGMGILTLVIIVFTTSLGTLFFQSRHILRQEAQERASSVLNTTMQRFTRHLNAVETATDVNAWLITKYLQPDSLLNISRNIVQRNPHVDGCSISAEPEVFPQFGGHFSAYTVREPDTITTVIEEKYDYFSKVWYATPRDNAEPCWVVYYDEADSLELTLDGMIASYSKPLYNSDGKFVAVVSTDLSLRRLSEVINAERPYPNSYYIMTGADGHFIIHPDTTQLFVKTIFDGANPYQNADIISLGHQMTSGHQGSIEVKINGVSCLVSYQPVAGTNWSLAIICPYEDILHGYHRLVIILIPLVIVSLIIILVFCRKSVTHAILPLNQLAQQSYLIAKGNYDARPIGHTHRSDVIGRLQNSFATMQESLSRHVNAIRQAADETARQNKELAQATLLAEESDRQKTTFIQGLTHQIRTPLNIIMGFAQVMRDTSVRLPEEEMKGVIDMMRHNGHLLGRMVLMLYESSDTGSSEELNNKQKEMVSCNDIAREDIDYICRHFANISIDFHTNVPDDFSILTIRLYLLRSISELLYNSAKYSDGKHISLTIEHKGESVFFIIQDTGPGIPKNAIDKMFKPFTKINELSEGLGLGLSLTYRHIVNLGGTLTLDTDYDNGCRFIIELPIGQSGENE